MWELVRDIPDVSELLKLSPKRLGIKILFLLKSRLAMPQIPAVTNNGMFILGGLENELWHPHSNLPKYPREKVNDVSTAILEAWAWLENQGLLVPAADINGRNGWRVLSRRANNLKSEADLIEKASDTGQSQNELTVIAHSRLDELRKLVSTQFDFKRLIRLCEEINTAYKEKCYLSTAMLTRGLLDHVSPIFGKKAFSEVANNYIGGSKSFKETMHHLENAARKIADAHLHTAIRKNETLPTAQQVNFASQLDVLLSEIVRITH